jgi:hypothetical protein
VVNNAPADRPNYAAEVKHALNDPMAVCAKLGLLGGKDSFRRQSARGVSVRCPWHDEKTPSCSVTAVGGLVRVKCFGCGQGGDVLSLVAAVRGLSASRDFRAVLVEAATMAGLHAVVHELETRTVDAARPKALPPRAEPAPERDYPPDFEIRMLLDGCVPVTDDADVAAHLAGRSIDPELVADAGLAWALTRECRFLAFGGAFQGSTWWETGHRLVLPVVDSEGIVRSVRSWRVLPGESPKRLPPGGYRAAGLFLADAMAASWLRGESGPRRVLIAEGEPDWLTAATWRMREPTAVLGIVSGSWTSALAARFRPGQRVLVWTDRDRAGDAYAAEIVRSLAPRGVFVDRWTGGADDG